SNVNALGIFAFGTISILRFLSLKKPFVVIDPWKVYVSLIVQLTIISGYNVVMAWLVIASLSNEVTFERVYLVNRVIGPTFFVLVLLFVILLNFLSLVHLKRQSKSLLLTLKDNAPISSVQLQRQESKEQRDVVGQESTILNDGTGIIRQQESFILNDGVGVIRQQKATILNDDEKSQTQSIGLKNNNTTEDKQQSRLKREKDKSSHGNLSLKNVPELRNQ
uniref:Uncharacterized protein n=1 Tax=Clytia hemisphaerica TaxID=252671 RepID=A0A7M5V8C5_9CNID